MLDEVIRQGANAMLQSAIELEVAAYVDACRHHVDEAGHRLVVRNGFHNERDIGTGIGPLTVKKPRVHDRREGRRFTSSILPPYMRRTPLADGTSA